MTSLKIPGTASRIDGLGLFFLASLAAIALAAVYAALSLGWFHSAWELVIFLAVVGAVMVGGVSSQGTQQGTVAHSQFATREDIDRFGIEADLSRPEAEDQGLYLGRVEGDNFADAELRYKGAKHLLCFGPTGSGKSNSIMIPNLQTQYRSIIVTDIKGEGAAITFARRKAMGSKNIVLNPFGVLVKGRRHLKSVGWNPLLQLDPESDDFESDARCIAEAMVERSGDSKAEYFETSAENLLTAFCMWERIENSEQPSLRNVRFNLALPTDAFLLILKKMAASDNYALSVAGSRAYARLVDKNSQSTSVQDIIETAMKSTAFLNDERLGTDMLIGDAIPFAKMHRQITTIYLILPPDQLNKQAKWLRMFISLALVSLYRSAPTDKKPPTLPRILFMLDEFGNLGKMQEIIKAQNLVRSYRIQLWLFLQNIGQLTGTYKDCYSDFFSNAGAVTAFKPGQLDRDTTKHLAEAFGDKETMVYTQSNAGGTLGPQAIPLIRPADIARLSAGKTINIIEPCPWPVCADTPVYVQTRFKEGLEPNPTFFG